MAKKKKEYDTYDAMTGTFSGSKPSKSSSHSSSVVYNSMTGSFSNVSSQKPITTVKSDTKPKTTQPLQTVKTTMPSVNKDGYEKTNQKYGYYKYQDYKNKKDYDIYKKDGKAYYYDPKTKTYNDMDTYEITTPEQEKEELKEAKKYGYKERKTYKTTKSGKRVEVLPNTIAERVELETSGLTKKEKKKYAKALIKQKDKEVKKSSYVREGNTLGELKYMAKSFKENTEPLGRVKDSYDYGKLQQEMSLAYSDMLKGKKVDISKIQRKIDNYNKFNKDVAEANTMLDTYVKSVPGQLRGMKKGVENAGALGTIGAIGGGTIGAVATKTPQGAVAGAETGAKWLGGAGYVKGQAQNTYELESGATYQTLLEMGVPDKIARKEAKRVGTENALIESGESILDLLTFGKAGAATNALKEGLIKKYGAEALKKWGVSYATNIISEGLEEGTQEQRSIAAEKRAAEKAGIERDDSQDVQRILESAKAGGFGAAITGAGTRIAGMGGSSVYNITKQKAAQMLEIQQQVNNGTMTHEEANQKIEQVNNGTYEENKNIDQIAAQQRDAIDQAVQTGQISEVDAAQEIQALNNTLTSERERINGTQEQVEQQEEKPRNIGKHYGDLGKANDTYYSEISKSRSTGHFGTGTYFVSENYEPGGSSSYAKRPKNEVSFDDYNLYKPTTDQDGYDLHDGLKAINSKDLFRKEEINEIQKQYNNYKKNLSDESIDGLIDVLEKSGYDVSDIKEDFEAGWSTRAESNLRDMAEDIIDDYDMLYKNYNKMIEQIKKNNPNISDEAINNAFEKTNQALEEYKEKGYKYGQYPTPKIDSLSTIFMKNLGYEGIDVRHLKGLDDTTYGSVIYDLKNNEKETTDVVKNAYKDIKNKNVKATIAPYYNTPLTKSNYRKIKSAVDESFRNTANNIATLLGANIKETTNNIGGFTFEEGEKAGDWVKELSYTFELENASKENAILFTSLMGDLGYEQQEAVIAATYEDDINNSNAVEFRLNYKNREQLSKALDELGIHDYTIDIDNKQLKLLEFDDLSNPVETAKKIVDIIEKLGGDLSDAEYSGIQSEYIDKGSRERTYKTWLEANERSEENGELYSLIEEAYNKVKEFNSKKSKEEQSSFSNETEENVISEKIEKPTKSMKEIKQEVEEKTNKTMSKHIETSSKATGTVEDIRNMDYDTIVYDTKTHEQSKEQALRELEGKDIDTNVNDVHAKFRGTERLTNVDSAKITELMKQTKELANEAAKNNNDVEYNKRMEQFRTLKGDYAVALSESGQFTEYSKVIKELDPDTQIDVLKKVIEREKRRGNKKYEDVTVNEKLVEKYKKAKTDEERDTIMEEIKDDTARQIKITFVDKANEFRFLSMLGNIKTHGRNIFGNAGMYSLQSFKDGVAAIGEDVYDKVSKNGLETRSKTLKPATKEVSKFVNDKVDVFLKDQKNKYNESRGMKGDLEGRTKKFSDNNIIGKALNKASNLNSKALDFEDRYFSSKMTKQAMKGFLTANGIETNADIEAHPELVAQALDYALFKGKEATFHQDSTTATAIRNLRDKLYTGSGFSKLGGLAVDTTLPFISTPANIGKNALEYTPIIGFGDINKQFQQAPKNMKANVVIDTLSKQFTGGALMAVGAYLASKGLIKGSGDDDKEDKTEASLGNASYSIKIGKSTYDLSWLSPTAIPFFEGVEVFNAFKKAKSKGGIKATDTADLIDTMFGTLNPMTDMSVLQSVERVITSIAYGGNAVKSATSTTFSSYLQQYIPTLFSQFAQIGDSKQRNTNTGGNVLSKTFDQIKYKIPGARNTLPEKVDVWGNTNKTANNIPQRMFEALLSPANRKDYKVDKTTKELERLARETDDTAMLPTVKNKSLRVNKKDYELRGKDFVNLQKTYGKTAKKNLDKLIESDSYKNASDTEKQKMVRKLYDYASYKAKENYAKNKDINFDSGDQTSYAMIDAFKIPYEKYVESKVSGNDSAAKMINKLNKAGFTKSQKAAIMNYFDRAYYVNEDKLYSALENSNLSDKQKELVRKKYEKSITDSERERYKRADKIGVDYDLYAKFRTYVTSDKARGESRTGGKTKRQKVIDYIENLPLSAKQKYALYDDWNKNQRVFQYYK